MISAIWGKMRWHKIDKVGSAKLYSSGLFQDYSISRVLAMEILQSCTNPSISCLIWTQKKHMYGGEICGMTKQNKYGVHTVVEWWHICSNT